MSNNEILSPTETERQPFRQNQNGSGEKLKQPESPTRPSKISFRDVPSPPKSRNNAEEKPQVSLSDIERTGPESKAGTRTRILDGGEHGEVKRKSRVMGTKMGSKILDDRRRTKKMTTRSQNALRERKRRQEEEEEIDLHAQSNSELYNLQAYFHKAAHAKEDDIDPYERREELKKTSKKFHRILKFKLNLPMPVIEIPPFFEETRHKINEERDIPKTEMLRDIEIGEKGDLEILRDKRDNYPLAEFRKKISKIMM